MRAKRVFDIPRWYAINTHPKQETRAEENLNAWGIETFNPKLKQRLPAQRNNATRYTIKALFPGYIFARLRLNGMLHKISYTRGVRSIVSFGGIPTVVDDEIINFIQAQVREDGFIFIEQKLKAGDKVRIKYGPLSNLAGIFEREIKDTDRVLILLAAVSYQGHIIIERDLIEKFG
jgi:transcriptional antiterminator RfaH